MAGPAKSAAVQSTKVPGGGKPPMSLDRKTFWRSAYTNADAEVVKKTLNLASVDAAKEYIGRAIRQGKESSLPEGVTRHLFDDQDCITRFNRSGFSAADVAKAKKSFDFLQGKSDTEVKSYLGLKLRNEEAGYPEGMQMLAEVGIRETKSKLSPARVAFWHSPYTNADAKLVKSELKLKSLNEAKEYIGNAILNKKEADLPNGVTRFLFDDQDCLTAFARAGFHKGDVAKARQNMSFLNGLGDQEVKAYLGLKVRNYESGYVSSLDILTEAGIARPSKLKERKTLS